MAPEHEALYALHWNVPRSELSMAAQLEYDRLRPAWERGETRPAAEELEAARLAWEGSKARSPARPVTGDQVRDTLFWPPRSGISGYDAREVDDLVRRVAAELDAGRPAGPVIENATLRSRIWGRRYDIDAVAWFFGQLLLPLGRVELAGIGADRWGDLAVARFDLGGVSGLAKFSAPASPRGQRPGLTSPGSARTRGAISASCLAHTCTGGRQEDAKS
jgi:hypothetical protein